MPAKRESVSNLNRARVGEICRRAACGAGLLCAVFLAPLAGCSRSPTKIVIDNRSGTTLSNVWVGGAHFYQSVGTIVPGVSLSITIDHPGKTRAALGFQARGKEINANGAQEFALESGSYLVLTVGKDLKVTGSDTAKGR